jgi:hypothetical protein
MKRTALTMAIVVMLSSTYVRADPIGDAIQWVTEWITTMVLVTPIKVGGAITTGEQSFDIITPCSCPGSKGIYVTLVFVAAPWPAYILDPFSSSWDPCAFACWFD